MTVATALGACGGGGSSSDSTVNPDSGVPGVTVSATPAIATQPADVEATTGSSAAFQVSASGSGLRYQWQRSTDDGTTWRAVDQATASVLALGAVTAADSGSLFRVQVSSSDSATTSAAARLTVRATITAPEITLALSSTQVVAGGQARFTVTASGTDLSYQWQSSGDGSAWVDLADGNGISGSTGPSLSFGSAAAALDGQFIRVVISNAAGSIVSDAATLRVSPASSSPVILSQPSAVTVSAGTSARFTVQASGQPAPALQWQRSRDGGVSYADISGATSDSLTITATSLADDGNLLRVIASSSAGSTTSDAAVLRVAAALAAPAFTAQPADASAAASQTVSFTSAAGGNPTPEYQWQVSTDGGTSFANINGATSATLSFAASATDSGRRYRVMARNSQGSVTSRAAVLTVSAPASNLQGRAWVTAGGNPELPLLGVLASSIIDDQGNVTNLVVDATGVLAADGRSRLLAVRAQPGSGANAPAITESVLLDSPESGSGVMSASLTTSPNGNLLAWWWRAAPCTAQTYQTSGTCNYIVASRRLASAGAWETPAVVAAVELAAFTLAINDAGDVVGLHTGLDAGTGSALSTIVWRAAAAGHYTTRQRSFSLVGPASDSFLPQRVALAADGSFTLAGQHVLGSKDVAVLDGHVARGPSSAATVLDQRVAAPTFQGLWSSSSGAAVVTWTQDNGTRATTYAATRDAVGGTWHITDTGVPALTNASILATVTDGGDFIWYSLSRCSRLRRSAGAWQGEAALPAALCGSATTRRTEISRNGHLLQVSTPSSGTDTGRWATYDGERAALVNGYSTATSGSGYVLGTPGFLKGNVVLSATGIAAWTSINTYTDLPSAATPNGDGPGAPRLWLRFFK